VQSLKILARGVILDNLLLSQSRTIVIDMKKLLATALISLVHLKAKNQENNIYT